MVPLHNLISLVAAVPTGQLRESVITHSFECAVESNDRGTWFNTDILVRRHGSLTDR